MVVAVMQVQLAIDWAESLKDKRSVVKSLRDTLHRHHMVSVAETDDRDIRNRATLGIAMVGSSGSVIGASLDRVLERIRANPDCELTHTSRDMLHTWGASFSASARPDDPEDATLEDTLRRRAIDAMRTEPTEQDPA